MMQRLYGPGHVETLSARVDVARVLNAAGKHAEGERVLQDSLGDARSFLGDGTPRPS